MAVHVAPKQRLDRAEAIEQVREEWGQIRKAVAANRPEAVLWRLQRVHQARGMHKLTLAELLVAGGTIG